jgi:hypothetical protein
LRLIRTNGAGQGRKKNLCKKRGKKWGSVSLVAQLQALRAVKKSLALAGRFRYNHPTPKTKHAWNGCGVPIKRIRRTPWLACTKHPAAGGLLPQEAGDTQRADGKEVENPSTEALHLLESTGDPAARAPPGSQGRDESPGNTIASVDWSRGTGRWIAGPRRVFRLISP